MGPLPLFNYPVWVIGLFYGALGIIAGIMGAKYTYCIVIATHQVMGLKYSKIYEIILTGIAVSALGVGILTSLKVVPYVDAYHFMPGAGWYTLLGSFIFGFGIMLGNGCMFGMLWKSGAGYVVNWFEIIGMIIGTIIFAFPIFNGLSLNKWWHTNGFFSIANGNPINFIPKDLGSFSGFALLIGLVFAIGIILPALWMRKNRKEFETGKGKLYESPYFLGTIFGLIMLASFVFAAGHFFNYLGVTTPVGLFASYLLNPFGINLGSKSDPNWFTTVPVISAYTFFILMVILGAFLYSAASGNFEVKLPSRTTNRVAEIIIALIGGIILAIGARMAQGCSVGGFWSGLTGLSIFGLIFTVGFIPGTIAGYYAYVNLSSWASSIKKNNNIVNNKTIQQHNKNHLYALIFGLIFGLLLIGISLELPGLNATSATSIKPALLVQYQNVLFGWGIFSIIMSFLIVFVRGYVVRR